MKPGRYRNIFFITIFIVFPVLCDTLLWAQRKPSTSGEKQLAEDFATRATAALRGEVIWEGMDLSQTMVQVYKDENLKTLYTGISGLIGGKFEIRVEPGGYYVVAFVDLNHSGNFDMGDGMGIFGITDWNQPDQRKQLVKVTDRQTISNLAIIITARMQDVNGEGKIVAACDYRANPLQEFKKELTKIASGVKGEVTWTGHESFKNALVFAYTDLSWKYRAGSARVEADGSFTIKLMPGKYYLMGIIDENNTNLFDQGDKLGIYGIANLRDHRAFPKPILVQGKQFTEGMEVAITGRQTKDGKIVSLTGSETEMRSVEGATATVSGEVKWAGQALKGNTIQVYRDPTLMKAVQQVAVDEKGEFNLQLAPGDYYLIANVDADGDGRYSQGDGLGAYGTADITTVPPASLTLKQGKNPDIELLVSARYSTDGQLEAVGDASAINLNQDSGSGISGRIIWEGKKFKEGILSLSETPDFESPMAIALNLEDAGRYKVSVPPGNYHVMVIVDVDGNRKAGLQDGVGIYGTRYPVRGNPQSVSVFAEHITPYIDMEIFAMYIDTEGNIGEIEDGHRSEIKLQYGEPEDVFKFTRFGRQIEEWWYWAQGVRFSFEAVGAGWKLQNRRDFERKEVDPELLKQVERRFEKPVDPAMDTGLGVSHANGEGELETTPLSAIIYYSYDNVIWESAPEGVLQQLGAGTRPTASVDGTLTYMDLDENVIALDSVRTEGSLLLDRRELARDVAISPDGEYIAFARRGIDRSRIYIRHLPTQEEFLIPSTAKQMFTPAWNLSGELLAYSTKGSIENSEAGEDRNIYAYDHVSQRIEPIVISPEDDAEPAWSPSNPNLLAFSRTQEWYRQIWTVEFSPEGGEPSEQQLTRYGGEKPVWLPDGSAILYENNGQLWLISKDGSENQPLRFKGDVIYGHEPHAIPFAVP